MRKCLMSFISAAILTCSVSMCPAETIPLSSLDLKKMKQGWGEPQVNRSIRETTMSIAGQTFEHGVGTHAVSRMWIDIGGAERFQANVGLDDAANGDGSIVFRIFGDGKEIYNSGVMKPGARSKKIDLPLSGLRTLYLKVEAATNGTQFDHANWAEARFIVNGTAPKAIDPPQEERVILTPKASPQPRLNNPAVYGCRPGNPFLYRIPTMGERPMTFSATDLPPSLALDSETGVISGTAPDRGEYPIKITARNRSGSASRDLRIISGDRISLTPYMGWNHWYTHYDRITDKLMREAADVMVSSGMADVGYDYVCIDDCWARKPGSDDKALTGPLRSENGDILTNAHFPDMKKLTDYIHGKGLKAGTYTSPGPLTCTGYTGAWQHEEQDAKQFAAWGFDLLKYDWCSYGKIAPHPNLEEMQKPYKLMGDLINNQKRDIIFNLCQYGMGNVWEWGAKVGGHSWRTAGDLGFELERIFEVAAKNAEYRAWNGPSTWNDPDYIQIGYIGDARSIGLPRDSGFTPNEQYAFMSMWSLSACPLMFSGDMGRLDEFTLNVLCNPEVIEINQDELGQCASVARTSDDSFIMIKDMADGSKAVGLCNAGETETTMTATWNVLGLQGKQRVRDVWRHKDIGILNNQFTTAVPRHAVVLIRIFSTTEHTE